ncbi:MAG: hypothetical protein WCP45_06495 [Verrucomicrobiota bacterium]
MKRFIPYSLIAAALACGLASAQTTAYTTPVGYTSQSMEANKYNLLGLNVLTPTLVQGTITSVAFAGTAPNDTTVVTVTGGNFTSVLPASRTCIFESLSAPQAGTVQDFVTWTDTTLTLPGTLTGLTGSYRVRVAPTLEEVFGLGTAVADSVIIGGLSATNSDKVWIPNGVGGWTKYYIRTNSPLPGPSNSRQYTNATTNVYSPNVPLVYTDGILIEKKGTAGTLVISGEVKTTGSNTTIVQGYNPIGITPPVGLTLFTSGMMGDIAGGLSATNSDIVWVPIGGGLYTKYWHKTNDLTAPQGAVPGRWHTTSNGTLDTGIVSVDVAMTPGIYIQRKSATGTPKLVTFDVPTGYSSL